MAVLTPFATTHRYLEDVGVTASSALTTSFRAEVVTGLGWTEPVGSRFKSPPDPDGRFFEIIVSEPSAVRWRWQLLNDVGTTIMTREILLTGAGETVRYHTGEAHVWVEIDKGIGITEPLGAGLLDLSPESQTVHTNYTWGRGFRNTSGNNDGLNDFLHEFFMLDNGLATARGRLVDFREGGGTQIQMVTFSGARGYHQPAMLVAVNNLAQLRLAGRMYQCMLTVGGFGSNPTVPIGDASETGLFRATRHRKNTQQGFMIRGD